MLILLRENLLVAGWAETAAAAAGDPGVVRRILINAKRCPRVLSATAVPADAGRNVRTDEEKPDTWWGAGPWL
jgi:hypothetical protein